MVNDTFSERIVTSEDYSDDERNLSMNEIYRQAYERGYREGYSDGSYYATVTHTYSSVGPREYGGQPGIKTYYEVWRGGGGGWSQTPKIENPLTYVCIKDER